MRRLVVSDRADADLREIWSYSFKTWGEAQADRYLDQPDDGLQGCRIDPERGRPRDDVRAGYWSLLNRRHVAFYTFTDDGVLIQRVLHSSMDPALHLDEVDDDRTE
jgi:toxin ParE1/3/4